MAESQGVAYSHGRYLPVEDAAIPILDPAFTKSDVVFDAVSVWDGSFFRLDDHFARFRASCEYVRMKPLRTEDEIKQILARCVDEAGLSRAIVYFLCTRGRYGGGVAFGDPRTSRNEFHAYSVPYYWVVPKDRVETGAHLWIVETRRAPNVSINQRVKSFNRMDLTRGQFEALDNGADQPLLLSTDGFLTEGPGFNVWIVKGDRVLTPGDNVLEGITRLTVFDLCLEVGLKAAAADLTPDDVYAADEAFLSSSGGGIIPFTKVNNRAIGNGEPGAMTRRLSDLYWKKRAQGWHATPMAELLAKPVPAAVSMD
jgi:branched-chain amino acid aminotransferase